ncbi:MAG: hypothetical protein ACTSPQ_12825 [Candidatus Helarchaeota archaeon]
MDKSLKQNEISKITRTTMLKEIEYSKTPINKSIIKDNLIFENNDYYVNQIIPILLKNMFLNALFKKFDNNSIIVNYNLNRISLRKNINKWVSFRFKFEIDDAFKIYLKIDPLYPPDFKDCHSRRNLNKSRERKRDNDNILKLIRDIQLFCGGKSYTLDSDFLILEKKIIEREC